MARNTFATIGILAVLLMSLGMVSAALDFYPESLNGSVQQGDTIQITFKAYNDYIKNFTSITYSTENLESGSKTLSATQTLTNLPPMIENKTNSSDITYSITIPSSQSIGLYSGNLTITGNYTTFNSYKLPIYLNVTSTEEEEEEATPDSWCTQDFNGEKGTIEIKNFYIDYIGTGDDEEWEALDEIIIEVDVRNTDSDDRIDDIVVEIKILDSNDKDVTDDFDFDDEENDLGRISKRTTETATFTISELPTDVEEDTYKIYVRAYDEDDENAVCVSTSDDFKNGDDDELYHEFDVVREDEAVIVKDLFETKILASCGDKNVEVSFPVYNIGDDEEEKVLVQLYNRELNIDEFYVIDSLRSGKSKEATFLISLPEKLSKTRYDLDIYTFFAYDEDEDELDKASYDENSNDIDRDASIRLEILSCRGPDPSVNANLESAAEIGTDLVVKAMVTNNGADNDFVISISDFESWADLVSVVPQTASIDEGEFTEVTITLSPKVAGSQSFKINTIADGDSYSQTVSVSIAEKPGLFGGMSDLATYIIIGIIAVLVLIFLVLIAKISRRPAKPQF